MPQRLPGTGHATLTPDCLVSTETVISAAQFADTIAVQSQLPVAGSVERKTSGEAIRYVEQKTLDRV
jgi:hypothetical protein